MKKIKIKIQGHNIDEVYGYSYFLYSTLKKYYEVELSDSPDYLFYNESMFDNYKYDCIKIFYTGENISPNFNSCDYAISFDYNSFEDRHYRMPLYLLRVFYNLDDLYTPEKNYLEEKITFTKGDLLKKTDFCSFVYSNYRAEEDRKKMFTILNAYKHVNSAGAYLNNTGGKKLLNKLNYETKHKFSIAFENSSRSGYTTEKIVGSIAAKTIPIYWGNPNIGREFNEKRFINCHGYNSFDEVLEVVKKIDKNDELYLAMVNQPTQSEHYNFQKVRDGFEIFLRNIFDQDILMARRRTINPVQAIELKRIGSIVAKYVKIRVLITKILATLYKPFKKIKMLEAMKYAYFSNIKK